jgi:hypothetical protein
VSRLPLWPAALVVWALTATAVGAASTPAAGGCDDRAIAGAVGWGGVAALLLLGADVIRRRRVWPVLLLTWSAVVTWVAWSEANRPPPDCDHLVAVTLTAALFTLYIGIPVAGVAAARALWRLAQWADRPRERQRPRPWRAEVDGSSLVIRRRRRKG